MRRPEITANAGQAAFRRGPLVYRLEKQDAPGIDLERAVVALDREQPSRSVTAAFRADPGMHVLKLRAFEPQLPATPPAAYHPATAFRNPNVPEATPIPFFCRANRAEDTRWITFIPCE